MDARVGPDRPRARRAEGDNVTARRIGADDRGQMFLLAGLVLALSLITMAVLANQAIHRPARESTQGSQIALGTYGDFRSAVREAIRFHLTSFGITEEAFAEAFRDLGDRRRLGLAGRDVDPIVELNGTKETRLCGGSPAYGNASLEPIAAKQTVDGNSECTNAANSDGILEDEDQDVVAAAVDVGLLGPRYAVEETMVVTAVQHRYILRDAVNTTIGADVRDSPTATDRSDGLVHRVRAPTPNVPAVAGYGSVPHSLYSGDLEDRDATWSVAVANPSDDPLDVDRVAIVDVAGQTPWSSADDAVDPLYPSSGWSIDRDTTGGQTLVWNGTDDRTVPAGQSLDFRADVRTASWNTLSSGGPDLDFETRVRASTDGGGSYDVYDLSDPSGPVLERAYDSLRGTERPTVSLRAEGGVVNVTSSTRSTMTLVVEEGSGAWSVPAHDLQVLIPTDIGFVGVAGSDCDDGIDCYNLTSTTSVPEGTKLTFRTQSIEPGSKATVDLRIDPPGVGTSTVYRAPMQLDPLVGDVPNATADAVVNVEPSSSTPYTLKMIYYSEPTTERLDRDDLVGMDVGLEMSANQAMNVTLQVWNHSGADGWGWRTLRSGVVDYAGVSWSVGWRTDDATELGVLDDEGRDLVPPLPSGDAPPEGAVAIRLLHDDLDTYRLDVDLAYWRVEHV